MEISNEFELKSLLEKQKFNRFHFSLTFLCLSILTLDGFDMAVMGFTASAIIDDFHASHELIGLVMSAGLVGLAAGAISGGRIADLLGRRTTILISVMFFGIMTVLTAYSESITSLIVLRFLTGLGLGAAQPNTATLISEYAPIKRRSVLICIIYCGITLGGALAGLASREVISSYGWSEVFLIGGLYPYY